MSAAQRETVAKAIYWAAYDQYIDDSYRHPLGFDCEKAWQLISEQQRRFCRRQADRAGAVLGA